MVYAYTCILKVKFVTFVRFKSYSTMNHTTTINLVQALALVGLIVLSACKFKDEPAQTKSDGTDPETDQTEQVSTGLFMHHVSNLETARFYRPAIYNGYFHFETNAKGDVSKVIDSYAPDPEVSYYQTERIRIDAGAMNGAAQFDTGEKEFRFIMKDYYADPKDPARQTFWELHRVPENVKKTINTDTRQLNNIAKTNGCDDLVLTGLYYGEGEWAKENYWLYEDEDFEGVRVKIESKGDRYGLKHSDFGVYTEDYILTPDVLAKTPSYAENMEGSVCHMHNVYAGGNHHLRTLTKPSNMTFKGGAVAQVQETDTYARRVVYANKATYTIDASGTETIDMPFDGWYHVVITRTESNITLELNNEENVPEQWKVHRPDKTNFSIHYGTQKNGLDVSYSYGTSSNYETPFTGKTGVLFGDKDKAFDNINVRNSVASIYYGDDPYNPTEAVVQGYRTDRYFVSRQVPNGIFFGFAFGGVRQK